MNDNRIYDWQNDYRFVDKLNRVLYVYYNLRKPSPEILDVVHKYLQSVEEIGRKCPNTRRYYPLLGRILFRIENQDIVTIKSLLMNPKFLHAK